MSDRRQRIRVGIVGASPGGSWAAATHLPALAHLEEFAVTAVATSKPETAREAAAKFGAAHAFTGAADLAAHPDVDLVVVSVKSAGHAEAIRAALAAGKHVYSEWPLGVDATETAELAEAAAAAGVVHAIGLQGYHSPSALFVRDLIAEGRIGRVESAAFITPGDPWGGARIPEVLAWGTDPAAGAGVLTIMVGHALATFEHLVGGLAQVSAVVANLHKKVVVTETGEHIANQAPGQVALTGRLSDGAVASLTVHGGSGTAGPDEFLLRIAGTEGTLTITPVLAGVYPHWTEWNIRLRSVGGVTNTLDVPARYRVVPENVPDGPIANVAALYREIGQAIDQGRDANPDFATALHYHRLLETLERASQTGRSQPVAE
ncbi:Gfo/Idh/MocA family protein [Actinomadura rudentiformis]|uniref:Gfo/Idh/MocA family oxidoreductase n=1 Tax=Actinomadura rudentiformis TaxID=359158 RepID=A0A6H9Z5H0_9ACTN|nr:Gfo/Idh/MocA family oxidoreductase [Actinomadura rudentiformis]KAB2352538.1 Gfo/Idh/MocA family oxidoreductase [Actinomadura rudentiformis]